IFPASRDLGRRLPRCPRLRVWPSRLITTQSEVAAVGIARFTLTRLCCSRRMSIHPPFLGPHVSQSLKHQRLPVGACTPSLALCSLDFPHRCYSVRPTSLLKTNVVYHGPGSCPQLFIFNFHFWPLPFYTRSCRLSPVA